MRTSPARLLAALSAASVLLACQEPIGPESPPARPHYSTTFGAELLECPTDLSQTAEATVGLFGGTISAGGSSITIPFGAVLLPTRITLTVPASNYVEVNILAGGAEHFEFEAPVAVTIDYSRCTRSDTEKKTLGAWYIDSESKSLIERMDATVDPAARTVRFETGHLSSYAVAH